MKILVVEDDAKTAEFVATGFRETGFVCDIAADGETGLAAARSGDCDIATVDIMLPRLNGLDLNCLLGARGEKLQRLSRLCAANGGSTSAGRGESRETRK